MCTSQNFYKIEQIINFKLGLNSSSFQPFLYPLLNLISTENREGHRKDSNSSLFDHFESVMLESLWVRFRNICSEYSLKDTLLF